MTNQTDIWSCSECEQLKGRHDMWFVGDLCEDCNSYIFYKNWGNVIASNQNELDELVAKCGGVIERDNHTYALYVWFEKEGIALNFEPNFDCNWGTFWLDWSDYFELGLVDIDTTLKEFDLSPMRGDLVAQKEFIINEVIKEIKKQYGIF